MINSLTYASAMGRPRTKGTRFEIRLSAVGEQILEALMLKDGTTKAAVVETALRRFAEQRGIPFSEQAQTATKPDTTLPTQPAPGSPGRQAE